MEEISTSSLISCISTVVLTFLTAVYVYLTKRILESQSEACVMVSLLHERSRPTIIQLVIRNIGNGIARDLNFELSKPIPMNAFGMETDGAKIAEVMNVGPLIRGIAALGPREERRLDWGQYGGLLKNLGEDPVKVTCRFKTGERQMKPVVCELDIKSFEYTEASGDEIREISKNIKKISENIGYLTTGFKTLKIDLVKDEQ